MRKTVLKRTAVVGAIVGGVLMVAAGTASATTFGGVQGGGVSVNGGSGDTGVDNGGSDTGIVNGGGLGGGHHHGGFGILNNACIAPWNWVGPGNVGDTDTPDHYRACENFGDSDEGGILNNACVAPWFWNGPGNVLDSDTPGDYEAC